MSRNSYEKLTKAPSSAPNLKPELSSGTLAETTLHWGSSGMHSGRGTSNVSSSLDDHHQGKSDRTAPMFASFQMIEGASASDVNELSGAPFYQYPIIPVTTPNLAIRVIIHMLKSWSHMKRTNHVLYSKIRLLSYAQRNKATVCEWKVRHALSGCIMQYAIVERENDTRFPATGEAGIKSYE